MKNSINFLVIICISVVLLIIAYWCFDIIPVYGYDANTKGDIVENIDEKEICGNIINKKYETILYYDVLSLNKMYIGKYSDKINQFIKTRDYDDILNNFHSININEICKNNKNSYIVKYTVCNDNGSEYQVTTIIKFNRNMSKAVIVYDSMFEVKNGE